MQVSTESRGSRRLRARRGPDGSPAAVAAAGVAAEPPRAAAAAAGAAEAAPACRICWQEADEEEGGHLLSPCRCAGSSRYVHHRCLGAWMRAVRERKGVNWARRCDVCRAQYTGLPRELRMREAPHAYAQRQAAALLASPVGTALSYYAAGGLVCSVAWALHGAACSVSRLHAMVRLVQQQPLCALRQLAPDLALSVASEACLSGQWLVPLLSSVRLAQGLALHWGADWAQARATAALPPAAAALAAAACTAGRLIAAAMQYTNMCLILLFGGLTRGFLQGAATAVLAPARMAMGAAAAVSRLACAAAGLLRLPHRRRRRQPPKQGSKAQQQPSQQPRPALAGAAVEVPG